MIRRRPTLSLALLFAVVALVAAAPAQATIVQGFSGSVINEDGSPSTLAGAHPYEASNTIEFTVTPKETFPGTIEEVPTSSPKDLITEQPLGLLGSPASLPHCSTADFTVQNPVTFAESNCPNIAAIGLAEVQGPNNNVSPSPIYNLDPPPGKLAEFGFKNSYQSVFIIPTVSYRPGQGYGVNLSTLNTSQGLSLKSVKIHLWGVPAAPGHDTLRGSCVGFFGSTGSCPSQAEVVPFIRNPTSCGGPPRTYLQANSWQEPGAVESREFESPAIEGCAPLPFTPSLTAEPTSHAADSPTGLKVDVHMPQAGLENPSGRSESDLREAVVTLPAGMAINPSAADGQAACSASQIDLEHGSAPASCPDAAKVGSVTIDTPLLEKPLPGSVYLAKQGENKFGSLLAVYVVVEDPRTGIVLKLPGKIATGADGQLTATFAETPQLPFEDFAVEFFDGPRAPLINPPGCGTYSTGATFSPWSQGATVSTSTSFEITSGPSGGACPNGSFSPRFSAGTTNPVAGHASTFQLRISREDGTQRLGGLTATLPKGLLAKLAGVPYCPDAVLAGISEAEGTGAAQLARPSCPSASQVGTVTLGAGAGPDPFFLDTGKVYLGGPYKGAPLSLGIVTPALAGPFDLGSVVVRTALRVDPESTQVTAISDPLPTVLHGIPIDLRDIRVNLDRPDFTVNPTNCEPSQVAATITGVGGASAALASHFQAASCAALGFKPGLQLSLKGGTRRAKFPALKAVVTYPPTGDYANVARAAVTLPRSEFLEQGHIGTVCTRVQFASGAAPGAGCPSASIYGRAQVASPLLDHPLEGPVYLRSSSNPLPDLVAALNGQVDVVLVGRIDSIRGGIRTTFEGVPDAPLSRFVLELSGGKKGLLVNSTDICKGKNRAYARFNGQNGGESVLKPVLKAQCRKGHKKGPKKRAR